MSKYKIINLLDKLFITISIFLIIYAWINFFIRDLWITFILSLFFSFAVVFVLFFLLNKKSKKLISSKKLLLEIEEKFLAFKLLSNTDKLNLIKNVFAKDFQCKKFKDSLLLKNEEKVIQIMLKLDKENLCQFDLINLISAREKTVSTIIIVCENFDANLNTKILKNLEIKILDKTRLYNECFLTYNLFPDCSSLQPEVTKKSFKNILKNFFLPNKAKSFFLCGLVLIFSSIILPYHTYYLIFGSLFLISSIICKLQPHFKH